MDWRGFVGELARICGRISADSWADWRGYVGRLVRIGGWIGADTWAE